MVGSDVEDWQRFLTGRGLLEGSADGIFGPLTAQATKDYQSGAGLDPDGVVGPGTLAQAVRDGFVSSTRAVEAGMDADVNCTSFASCVVTAGMKFVVRYYSRSASKAMGVAEAKALSAAGLKLAVVYQDRQNIIDDFSSEKGAGSAQRALDQAAAIGQPEGSAIYFAADFDPPSADVRGSIAEYFLAVNRAFSTALVRYAIGIYGSGLTCRVLRDASLAQFAWLSGSTGFRESKTFRPRAHLVQVAPERKICDGKLEIDDDIAQVADYGAFRL